MLTYNIPLTLNVFSKPYSKKANTSFRCAAYIQIVFFIFLTSCSSRHTPAPVVEVSSSIPLNKRLKNNIQSLEYIVKKGETLYSIAWRGDIDVRTLAKYNNISSPYHIYPGQKLFFNANAGKPIKNKLVEKSTVKSRAKAPKKAIAQIKKQAYGGKVSGNKVDLNQKVRSWQWPANGKVIRKYSDAKQGKKGIDIEGRRNESIKSAADGKVVYAGNALRGYGRLIIVKHNDDYLSAYAHNDSILVKENQNVKQGQTIARMGDTDAQRVMLHFEVRFRGKSVNPMKYLPKK